MKEYKYKIFSTMEKTFMVGDTVKVVSCEDEYSGYCGTVVSTLSNLRIGVKFGRNAMELIVRRRGYHRPKTANIQYFCSDELKLVSHPPKWDQESI